MVAPTRHAKDILTFLSCRFQAHIVWQTILAQKACRPSRCNNNRPGFGVSELGSEQKNRAAYPETMNTSKWSGSQASKLLRHIAPLDDMLQDRDTNGANGGVERLGAKIDCATDVSISGPYRSIDRGEMLSHFDRRKGASLAVWS